MFVSFQLSAKNHSLIIFHRSKYPDQFYLDSVNARVWASWSEVITLKYYLYKYFLSWNSIWWVDMLKYTCNIITITSTLSGSFSLLVNQLPVEDFGWPIGCGEPIGCGHSSARRSRDEILIEYFIEGTKLRDWTDVTNSEVISGLT